MPVNLCVSLEIYMLAGQFPRSCHVRPVINHLQASGFKRKEDQRLGNGLRVSYILSTQETSRLEAFSRFRLPRSSEFDCIANRRLSSPLPGNIVICSPPTLHIFKLQ
jgi:hypothetical protein